MRLILASTFVILVAICLVWLLLRFTLFRKHQRGRRPWYRLLLRLVLLALVLTVVILPLVLGYAGSRWVGTRHDESGYLGPRITSDGKWLAQSRATLFQEAAGTRSVDPDLRASEARHRVMLKTADGLTLRSFLVPPNGQPARARVLMVHGLFRGALELEPIARMFRDLGAEVLLLELRNHGGSEHTPATYGLNEAEDVMTAVRFLRSRRQEGVKTPPLVLFGISLGTAAVALAAPKVDELAGLVLEAPMTDLLGAAHRQLSGFIGLPRPMSSVALTCMEWWSGFDMNDVQVDRELGRLSEDIDALVIGAAGDDRMPPSVVREAFLSLRANGDRKELWIVDGAGHGRAWKQDPDGYRERLARLLARIRRR